MSPPTSGSGSQRERSRPRRAFTLVELLVVIAIIALLAALVVASAAAFGIGSKKAKTGTIVAALRTAIELTVANSGTGISPAEHPLAGSRPARAQFRGEREGAMIDLPTTGEALRGPVPAALTDAAARRRLLDADDRFADPRLPLLYGLHRWQCTVLGTGLEASSRWRRLPHPATGTATIPGPYDATVYRDVDTLHAPAARADAARAALEFVLANGNARSELARLGALAEPPDDDAARRIWPPEAIAGTNRDGLPIDNGGRVWSPQGPDPGDGSAAWKPGRVQDGTIGAGPDAGRPDWKEYRLRGLAVYDAWQRELLVSIPPAGGIEIQSAGHDGAFRIDPGPDGALATAAEADAPAGDDRDGARDNIRQGTTR